MNSIENIVVEHTQQIKTVEKRVDKLEAFAEQVNKLAISIEKMSIVQEQMLEEQRAQRSDINKIKEQPLKDAREIKNKVISAIITTLVGVILGALLALIIKQG